MYIEKEFLSTNLFDTDIETPKSLTTKQLRSERNFPGAENQHRFSHLRIFRLLFRNRKHFSVCR